MSREIAACIFEDRFVVRSLDGSKFEKVGRLRAKSSGFDAEIVLDVNTDLFPIEDKQFLKIGITNRVSKGVEDAITLTEGSNYSLLDQYDYCMYGRIFKIDEKSAERQVVYASFGGLLMALTADKHALSELELDMRIYILIRRTGEMI